MQNSVALPTTALLGFLLVLCRISGVFIFLPVPAFQYGSDSARIFLSLTATLALFPQWPKLEHLEQSIGALTVLILSEFALGLTLGLGVAFVLEMLQMFAQVAGLQAGYGFASTIDPNSQSDSGVLLVVAQTFGGLLFFAAGLDREVIRVFAGSLTQFPPGHFVLTTGIAEALVRLSSGIFSLGVRLAFPIVALLGLIDLSLALLGRLNAQLQLITLAFPIKMLAALILFAWLGAVEFRIFHSYAEQYLAFARGVVRGVAHGR
jgi:flagellar biosynthetic protein FliR